MCSGNNLIHNYQHGFPSNLQARSTHYTGVDESILIVGIALEQLVPQKRCILQVGVECDVDRQIRRKMGQIQTLNERHLERLARGSTGCSLSKALNVWISAMYLQARFLRLFC